MTTSTETRTTYFNCRIAPTEVAKLHAIAEHYGVSASDVVRMFIRERHRELFGVEPAADAKRAPRARKAAK
ncbi:MAG TPA: hypothetical protein VGM56_04225 [Byssovorax sp.]|jgi:hypothetical protein|nr:hypothetical protein [Polyangia bacterium]